MRCKKSPTFEISKKPWKVPCFMLFLMVGGNIHAEPLGITSSGPFYLQGGSIPPRQGTLSISLDTLPSGMNYLITCDIENPTWDKPYPIVISTFSASGSKSQYLLNQQLTQYSNRLTIGSDTTGSRFPRNFSFINHDDTDFAYVKNCMAVYATK